MQKHTTLGQAKEFVKSGYIRAAVVTFDEAEENLDLWHVCFETTDNLDSFDMELADARNPYVTRQFKTLEGALMAVKAVGLDKTEVLFTRDDE